MASAYGANAIARSMQYLATSWWGYGVDVGGGVSKSEEDKRATTNVQNGLVFFFLFSFIIFELKQQ